jgi:hypothetical protein
MKGGDDEGSIRFVLRKASMLRHPLGIQWHFGGMFREGRDIAPLFIESQRRRHAGDVTWQPHSAYKNAFDSHDPNFRSI